MKWQEPPVGGRATATRRDELAKTAAQLRAHPGAWALVLEDAARNVTTRIRQGAYAAFRPVGAWEIRSAKCSDSEHVDVYVRFVGQESD